jgi:F-type H+-transporting ATPase subunit c
MHGLGIGRIGGSALESIARQPEVSGDIRANMIVAAALIEGAAFIRNRAFVLLILLRIIYETR